MRASASSRLRASFTGFGASSTRAFASFRPRPVAALTTLSSSGDYLNQLDQALGDGDHGSTVARGSDAAIRELQARTFANVNQEFEAIGSAMMSSMAAPVRTCFLERRAWT